MKILLLGEFSSVHKLLKEGLNAIGHEAIVASDGDGYRNIERDINLCRKSSLRLVGNVEYFFRMLKCNKKFRGFDTVQLMTPIIFSRRFGLNNYMLRGLKRYNGKIFLLGAGGTPVNTVIADYFEKEYKYSDVYRLTKTTQAELWSQTANGREYNKEFHELIDGYIPIMYEYAQAYRNIEYNKQCKTIPFPINIDQIEYVENQIKNKIVIFHGISRAVKGTHLVKEVLEKIRNKYPNDVDVVLKGNLQLKEYLHILKSANIVIDQTHSLSYGVNAAYSMAMGKIVMGGSHAECLEEFGIKKSPMISIFPTVDDIELKIERLLSEKNKIPEIGYASRVYVEELHDYKKIAQKYIETWKSKPIGRIL